MQEPILFNMSIKENILYGKLDATDEEVFKAALAANALEFIESSTEDPENIELDKDQANEQLDKKLKQMFKAFNGISESGKPGKPSYSNIVGLEDAIMDKSDNQRQLTYLILNQGD